MFSGVQQLKSNCEQRILEYTMVKKLREKKVKEEQNKGQCEKSNDDWYALHDDWY